MNSYIRIYTQEDYTQEKVLKAQILNLLEQRGLTKKNIGTEFYAEVIANISYFIAKAKSDEEVEELKEQLQNPYSEFYFDIARNDNDTGLKTFHSLISDALPDCATAEEQNISINKDNYKEVAFALGNLINTKDLNKQSKTLKLVK